MSDAHDPTESTAPAPYQPNPYLLIFLIMPILAAILALLLAPASAPPDAGDPITPPVVGFTPFVRSAAPDFTLPALSGAPIQLRALRGQWVLLNFWATWCAPCRAEMPLMQSLYDGSVPEAAAVREGVRILTVNRDERPETIQPFMDELKLTLPVALDAGGQVANQFNVVQLPVTFVIDPNGIILYKQVGELTPDLLRRYLERMAQGSGG